MHKPGISPPQGCILFCGMYADLLECPKCHSARYKCGSLPVRKFIYLPLGPWLEQLFGTANLAELVQSHNAGRSSQGLMYDIHDAPMWREAYKPDGVFEGDSRGISLSLCTDCVNPFSHQRISYSMWLIMTTLLNFPRHTRNAFGNIILLGIVPSNGSKEPKSLSPYLEVFVDEILLLKSATLYDAYKRAPFQLKVNMWWTTLEYAKYSMSLVLDPIQDVCGVKYKVSGQFTHVYE